MKKFSVALLILLWQLRLLFILCSSDIPVFSATK